MKVLFSVSAVLMVVLGLTWLLVPVTAFGLWGVQPDAVSVYMGRRYAALFFGYAVILWINREASDSPAQTSILLGGLVSCVIMAVLSAMGVLTGTINASGWLAFVVETVLACGFGYFYFTRPVSRSVGR